MKKLLLIPLFLGICINIAFSERWLSNRSSRTTTADSLTRILGSNPGDTISSVIVSSCSSTIGALFRLFDSSSVSSGQIAALHISSSFAPGIGEAGACMRQYDFFIRVSSAITYTTTFGADVTILWQNEIGPIEQ